MTGQREVLRLGVVAVCGTREQSTVGLASVPNGAYLERSLRDVPAATSVVHVVLDSVALFHEVVDWAGRSRGRTATVAFPADREILVEALVALAGADAITVERAAIEGGTAVVQLGSGRPQGHVWADGFAFATDLTRGSWSVTSRDEDGRRTLLAMLRVVQRCADREAQYAEATQDSTRRVRELEKRLQLLERRYRALARSKLGRLTLWYWKRKKGRQA